MFHVAAGLHPCDGHAELIRARYLVVHGACPEVDYPSYLSVGPSDAPDATLGYRFADDGPLFLETYLDNSIEAVLAERLGRAVPRPCIVELGNHASARRCATLALWQQAATSLATRADVAVAVLTAPLRAMIARLGIPLIELAPARIEALRTGSGSWGRYYDSDPIVCAGEIAPAVTTIWPRKIA